MGSMKHLLYWIRDNHTEFDSLRDYILECGVGETEFIFMFDSTWFGNNNDTALDYIINWWESLSTDAKLEAIKTYHDGVLIDCQKIMYPHLMKDKNLWKETNSLVKKYTMGSKLPEEVN